MSHPAPSSRWNALTILAILASLSLTTFILWLGASILIPIILAGLLWFALVSIARLFQGIGPDFRLKSMLSHMLAWVVLAFVAWVIATVISTSVRDFINEIPSYEAQLTDLATNLAIWVEGQTTKMSVMITGTPPEIDGTATNRVGEELAISAQIQSWVSSGIDAVNARLPQAATSLLSATQSSVVTVFTVLIYLIFFYSESSSFPKKLAALNREEADHQRWSDVIALIVSRLASYIRIKTLTSALTGGLGFLLMASLNVNFALVFALLLFLLNYIPIVGSLISSLLPIVLFMVDVNFSWSSWFILVIGLLLIQQGVGSVLEPRLLANSFNMSSILVMTSLVFWGSIWGVFGMLISAPIMAAVVILLANFQGSRQLAILLSADGNIDNLRPNS